MPATITLLTKGSSGADQSSYNTASITPSAGKLILVFANAQYGSPAKEITGVTGCGLTWTRFQNFAFASSSSHYAAAFRATGTPSAGALTIASSGTQSRFNWQVIEVGGVDVGGTNGSNAIVQSNHTTSGGSAHTSITLNLSAFTSALNIPLGVYMADGAITASPGSGFSTIASETGNDTTFSEYGAANDSSVDCSFSSTSNYDAIIGVELKVLPLARSFGVVIA